MGFSFAKLYMRRGHKIVVTHLDCAPPLELVFSGASQEEIDKALEEKRKNGPPILVYEIECEPAVLAEKLKQTISEDLDVDINYVDYELEDAHGIGEA